MVGANHAPWFYLLFLLHVLVVGILSDTCGKQTSCGDCIRDSSVCVWCAKGNFNGTRCRSAKSVLPDWCTGSLQNPQVTAEPAEVKNFSSELAHVIQIQPHKYKLKLRPGVPVNFTFSFQPASDYPVDLYFLFDTSHTMKDVMDVIEDQSKTIYDTMYKLTKNINLGMGSFVDKNTLPYTNKIDKEKTYSFRHRLKMVNDPVQFRDSINSTAFGSNFDPPEGGLDALAQVMSCGKNIIGWREQSRKLVVFLTNGPYHVAGDGMIGGIFQPYDGQCYTNSDGVYTKELEMDYPSTSMINRLAAAEEMTVIFAVHSLVQSVYSHLSSGISGSNVVIYDGGSTNISEILTNIYKNIARKIKLKAYSKSGHRNKFDIRFDPDCTRDSSVCAVKEGEMKTITVTIKALEYFGLDNTEIDVVVEGIKEKLTLDIDIIKECPCSRDAKPNSEDCNNGGTLKCGICECDKNRYGANCACIKNSASSASDSSSCVMPGEEKVCSGHGSCICGNCICRKNSAYEGEYCQFNKDNCPRHNKVVCSGHGRCENERCLCSEGWEGPACECPKSNATCLGANGEVCNGMGTCTCGKCECRPTASWDARDNQDEFCAIRPCRDCHEPQCNRLATCTKCIHSKQECSDCDVFKASISEYSVSPLNDSWNVCPDISGKTGCYIRYMYRYSQDAYLIELVVQAKDDCLQSYYTYGGIALGVLILFGIAGVVLWKWVTHARDRREYERFLKEHEADLAPVCTNPTYRPASTTTTNPAFRKPSVDFSN